jgi:membrane protein YqaA with SNARE-associated domain
MSRFAAWIQGVALSLGAPGLFLIAFLDSSFLSLPEIADIMVVYMVTQHPSRVVLYVLATTTGSMCGCLLMYFIGRKGGEAVVRKRFAGPSVERAMGFFQRYGVVAVLIPSLLPPPMPFKIFVLLSGVSRIPTLRFLTAIAIGRGLRYSILGALAIRYGRPAMAFIRENVTLVSLVAAGLLLVMFAVYLRWARAAPEKA